MSPTLNIAALTRRTGVPPDTIRKWEQRYGVLRPQRTSGGQRRYTESDIARIEWLKARLEEGYRIGEAAALLGDTSVVAASADELRTAFVDAAADADVSTLDAVVHQTLLVEPIEAAFGDVLAPALVEIGERWARGALTVAQEHLASSMVRSALQRLLADRRGAVRGTAVLACAPGEQHEIGLMMFAVLLRADGWEVAYLGPEAPVDDTLALANAIGAAAVCFSAGMATVEDLRRELARRTIPDDLHVVVGGRGTEHADARAAVDELHALHA
ncbi:MAG TPA: MerR family transcriptional regulator [Gaiellaceae bacterium]|jgi:methanogenic corrinoid protein MtbC1|nr:MerR family transcriptional regulator [Gaiellaceae bacterium]